VVESKRDIFQGSASSGMQFNSRTISCDMSQVLAGASAAEGRPEQTNRRQPVKWRRSRVLLNRGSNCVV